MNIAKKLKGLMCLFLAILIFGAFAMKSNSVFALEQTSTEYFNQNYDKIKPISRIAQTDDGYCADFAGGGVAFNLTCFGKVTMNVDVKGNIGIIEVIINDDFSSKKSIKITEVGEQDIVLAENLEQGEYCFEVIKANPQYVNTVTFKSITFNGTLGLKPPQKDLKLEFYGDSISCGVGALSDSINSTGIVGYEDNYLYSYNAYCARYLNAEISTCALPGYGYYLGYDTGKGQDIYSLMGKAMVSQDYLFDNSSYIADVVVIALGTNDVNFVINNSAVITDNEIYQNVQRYIDKIRSYNKNCYIILLGSPSSAEFNINNKVNGKYIKLTNALVKTAAINEKVLYAGNLGMTTSGRGWHPNAAEAQIGGKTLADYITENVLSGKEPPAVIPKDEFYLDYDLNNDDKFTTADILRMRRYLAKLASSATIDLDKADFNKDGMVNAKDVRYTCEKLLNISYNPS